MAQNIEISGIVGRRALRTSLALGLAACSSLVAIDARAQTVPEALVKAYQTNPQLNAERARQRATDENVPQALSGYRPQVTAVLGVGLQAVRDLLPDNTILGATLKPWTIGVTVTQTLFNGFRTANSVRVAEFQVKSGREALRNVGQGVLLDAVTAYTNVLANQALVEAQRANVASLRETLGIAQKRLNAGDVTPTDTSQAEARLARGMADLNNAEVNLAISQSTYLQIIGSEPSRLAAAEPVDRLLPRSRDEAVKAAEFAVSLDPNRQTFHSLYALSQIAGERAWAGDIGGADARRSDRGTRRRYLCFVDGDWRHNVCQLAEFGGVVQHKRDTAWYVALQRATIVHCGWMRKRHGIRRESAGRLDVPAFERRRRKKSELPRL